MTHKKTRMGKKLVNVAKERRKWPKEVKLKALSRAWKRKCWFRSLRDLLAQFYNKMERMREDGKGRECQKIRWARIYGKSG